MKHGCAFAEYHEHAQCVALRADIYAVLLKVVPLIQRVAHSAHSARHSQRACTTQTPHSARLPCVAVGFGCFMESAAFKADSMEVCDRSTVQCVIVVLIVIVIVLYTLLVCKRRNTIFNIFKMNMTARLPTAK